MGSAGVARLLSSASSGFGVKGVLVLSSFDVTAIPLTVPDDVAVLVTTPPSSSAWVIVWVQV